MLFRLPLLLTVLSIAVSTSCTAPVEPPRQNAPSSPIELLNGDAASIEGYARAETPRDFVFPTDHGPHPDFQTEWWYFTGHLDGITPDTPSFGFQWTIFRRALAPTAPERASAWSSRQMYMGHFALGELDTGRFHAFERFARGAVGLAGASTDPFRVWLEDWQAASIDAGRDTIWPLRLQAAEDGVRLDIQLTPGKPLVLQGDRGLSFKNADGASYYYSYTRLDARGRVTVDGVTTEVDGSAWLDREWSTSVLSEEQAGWDWFSLQLADDRDVMVYQLRRHDGSIDEFSAGLMVTPDGSSTYLKHDDFTLDVTSHWRSPRTDGEYPAGWRLRLPGHDLDLAIEPLLNDQELDVAFPYWEGAVRVAGTTEGRGFVELVGYAADESPDD
ncbi:MAG: lipocalin-like domain-containing protein [Acidobacteriota bacterium]